MFQHRLMAPPARIFNVPILIATHHNQPVVTIAGTAGANRGRATWAHNPAMFGPNAPALTARRLGPIHVAVWDWLLRDEGGSIEDVHRGENLR